MRCPNLAHPSRIRRRRLVLLPLAARRGGTACHTAEHTPARLPIGAMVAPNSDWTDATQSGDDGERGHGLLTGSRVEQLAGDGRRCGEGAEKGRAERREWWRHGHSRAERGRTERRPQGRSGTRPWRELHGWLLRSAREPDPWRLGSGRTTEGKGAGQSGRERLGLITPMVGHPNGTGEIAEVVELAPTESAATVSRSVRAMRGLLRGRRRS